MTKKEFVHAIMERHGLLKSDAETITRIVFQEVQRQLVNGREVRIDGVGSFSFKFRQPGMVNNNLLGEHHEVGPRVKLRFKPYPSMQKALKRLAAEMNDGQD